MNADKTDILRERLRLAIKAAHSSAYQAAVSIGKPKDFVRDFLSGRKNSIGAVEVAALERVLGLSQGELTAQDGPGVMAASPHLGDADMAYENGPPNGLLIKGSVAAGAWFEIDPHLSSGDLEFAPVVPSPEYPAQAQYALRVKGDSINKIALEGDLLRCLDLGITGLEPRDGDLVIVEQSRDDGLLREVTAKRVTRVNGHIHLEPESTNPRWQPIIYDPARDDGSIIVRIIAIVDAVIRPIFRRQK